MTSFSLNSLCKDLITKYSHLLKSWELGHQHMDLRVRVHNSTHNIRSYVHRFWVLGCRHLRRPLFCIYQGWMMKESFLYASTCHTCEWSSTSKRRMMFSAKETPPILAYSEDNGPVWSPMGLGSLPLALFHPFRVTCLSSEYKSTQETTSALVNGTTWNQWQKEYSLCSVKPKYMCHTVSGC